MKLNSNIILQMNLNKIIDELIVQIDLKVFYEHFLDDKQEIDRQLVEYLEAARTSQQIETSKIYLNIILDYSWEKLNTGIWQNVKDAYRYLYAYACYLDVLTDCRLSIENYQVNRSH
mgnify:CR=1 FL=1